MSRCKEISSCIRGHDFTQPTTLSSGSPGRCNTWPEATDNILRHSYTSGASQHFVGALSSLYEALSLRARERLEKGKFASGKRRQQLLEIRYRYFKINLAGLPSGDEILYCKFSWTSKA